MDAVVRNRKNLHRNLKITVLIFVFCQLIKFSALELCSLFIFAIFRCSYFLDVLSDIFSHFIHGISVLLSNKLFF